MSDKQITIAIDGYSSCGKSTLAKELAKELEYVFVDSGAMYRGVTLYALRSNLISKTNFNRKGVIEQLNDIEIQFELNEQTNTPELLLNGENVELEIRTPEISSFVSRIAELKEVREKLVLEQQRMGLNGGVIMDGRDIGSVVFPKAELKIFVTADIDTRVERRYKELIEKGFDTTREEVKYNLIQRDHIDSTREESPLTKTDDSVEIDNTDLSRDEQLKLAIELVNQTLSNTKGISTFM